MMKLFEKRAGKKTRGQTMVEFALILPVLLMTMYGVMEFGRLLFIYVTTTSAAREAIIVDYFLGIDYNGIEDARIPIEDSEDPLLPLPATPGYDYIPPSSPLTIPAGTMQGIIRVPIFDDSWFEGQETIKIILGQPTNGNLGEFITHRLTIIDNEVAEPYCNLSIAFSGNTATITNNGSYPIYITRINTRWTSSNRTLTSINFGEDIWSGPDTSGDANITFGSLNNNRRLLNETKDLSFTFSPNNNNTGQNYVNVDFDNGCSIPFP
jgi:hypothetical protein